jgi:putative redox protein
MPARATIRWTGEKTTFDVEGGSGHTAIVDSAEPLGGDAGLRPTEMMLGALAACGGVNAVLLLKKMRQPLRSLEVHVEGDQEPEWPHRFTGIRMEFRIGWSGVPDPELVAKAIELSVHRYCPVHATLSEGVPIVHSAVDVGEQPD